MTALKKGTKKYDYYLWASKRYAGHDLNDVYTKCSTAKREAELAIKREMVERDGYNYHITGKNCNYFSCAFETKTHIYYHTHSNEYVLEK